MLRHNGQALFVQFISKVGQGPNLNQLFFLFHLNNHTKYKKGGTEEDIEQQASCISHMQQKGQQSMQNYL